MILNKEREGGGIFLLVRVFLLCKSKSYLYVTSSLLLVS